MKLTELPVTRLTEASWNPNHMDPAMLSRLRESISRFGMVGNLVVRLLPDGLYEVLSGNQRLQVLAELGYTHVPCVVVDLDDAEARLLAQALNRIEGEDDLGMKAELVRHVLESLSQGEVLSLLPETAESLQALTGLGQTDMAEHLRVWQQAQAARLRHLTFQFSGDQLELVEEALSKILRLSGESAVASSTGDRSSPNRRGTALAGICRHYLENMGGGR